MMYLLSSLVKVDLSYLQQPPLATIFILGLVTVISLVTSLLTLKATDLEDYRKMMIESSRVRYEMMEAIKSGDQRRISKAQRRQQELMKAQSKMTADRMKITLLTIVPIIIMWQILIRFFKDTTVAYMPFNAPLFGTELKIGGWYIFCSFATSIIFQRILGLTFEIGPNDY